jgi:hypothetical protein
MGVLVVVSCSSHRATQHAHVSYLAYHVGYRETHHAEGPVLEYQAFVFENGVRTDTRISYSAPCETGGLGAVSPAASLLLLFYSSTVSPLLRPMATEHQLFVNAQPGGLNPHQADSCRALALALIACSDQC